jgi:hypothetical protein
MAPIGSLHARHRGVAKSALQSRCGDAAIVLVQVRFSSASARCRSPTSLLKPRADSYTRSHPKPADVLLVIEVSDTTLEPDLRTVAPLYAARHRGGRVVDLQRARCRSSRPDASGYRTSFTASGEAT